MTEILASSQNLFPPVYNRSDRWQSTSGHWAGDMVSSGTWLLLPCHSLVLDKGPANDSLSSAAALITRISLDMRSAWLPLLSSRVKKLPWKASGQQTTLTGTFWFKWLPRMVDPGDLVLGHENEDKVLEDLPDSTHQDLTRWSDTAAREAGKCSPFSSSQESS